MRCKECNTNRFTRVRDVEAKYISGVYWDEKEQQLIPEGDTHFDIKADIGNTELYCVNGHKQDE